MHPETICKEIIAEAISKETGKGKGDILKLLANTTQPKFGDITFPCFALSKELKKSPDKIAEELKGKISRDALSRQGFSIQKVEAVGAYLNFFIKKDSIAKNVLNKVLKEGETYGKGSRKTERVMIEFSQPNTHKAFHIGHLRNAALGDSLVRIMRFNGYKVIGANYPGDIGAHVAKCLWCLKKYHLKDISKIPAEKRGEWLGEIYVEAVKRIGDNNELKKEATIVGQKLEHGDKELTKLWKQTREWSLQEFKRIYKELGIDFDVYFFESEVEKQGKKVVLELLKKGIAKESEGAIIMDLRDYGLDIFLLLRSDGTSLYSTKDIALAKEKFEKYKIDKSVYVVGSEQKMYFQQLFKTLELMGFENAKKCYHLSYELVMLEEGKMSSREGNIVLYSKLASDVFKKALEEVEKRHNEWSAEEKEEAARKIALGAMKFSLLNQDNNKVIVFNTAKALDFEGETAAYVQYAYTRASSILRKNAEEFKEDKKDNKKEKGESLNSKSLRKSADFSKLETNAEIQLIRKLAEFPDIISKASEEYKPFLMSKYLLELSKLFTAFYHECPIIKAEPELRKARLALVESVRIVLKSGLSLIGIEVLERM